MERFGEYARIARERQRVSLRSLAETIGLSAPYVSDIERGNRNPPDVSKLTLWANAIDEDTTTFVRRAELDRKSVEIPVNHNPANAELAMAFARKIDRLSDDEREALKKIFGSEKES